MKHLLLSAYWLGSFHHPGVVWVKTGRFKMRSSGPRFQDKRQVPQDLWHSLYCLYIVLGGTCDVSGLSLSPHLLSGTKISRQDLRHVSVDLLASCQAVVMCPRLFNYLHFYSGQDLMIPKYISVVCVIWTRWYRCAGDRPNFLHFYNFYNFYNSTILQLFTMHCTSYNIHNTPRVN